jgi:hypothetical protein
MKVRIKSFNGELPDYLTLWKEYEVFTTSDMWSYVIKNDINKNLIIFNFKKCKHLNGGSWEIVE